MKSNSYIEISRKNLLDNFTLFKEIISKQSKMFAVVKSNAYGHGILEVSRTLEGSGLIDGFCVNSLEEGVLLRKNKIRLPILCLGFVSEASFSSLVENKIDTVFYRLDSIREYEKVCKENNLVGNVFLKIETGTNRQGILEKDLEIFLRHIKQSSSLHLNGISSHLANVEDVINRKYFDFQMNNLRKIKDKYFIEDLNISMASSAAFLLFPESHFSFVRVGIAAYGLWPSKKTFLSFKKKFPKKNLKPVLSWKTNIAQIKEIPSGSYVSYGCTFRAKRKTKIAVLPVGYFEGYSRSLSGKSHVLIKGKRAPVLGRICMNMMIVDVTDIPGVSEKDKVVLIGKSGQEKISVESLAEKSRTINYEFVSRIHEGLDRALV